MRVAVFHELMEGGALYSLRELTKELKQKGDKVDIYTSSYTSQNVHKNIFYSIFQIIFSDSKEQKKIARIINNKKYDMVVVFPSIKTQSPHILRYLNNKRKTFYFFTESKREFYEKTSFDYNTIRKTLARAIRWPIKIIDQINCRKSNLIICNSVYTQTLLKKIYGMKSFVIYPGLDIVKPKEITIIHSRKLLSVGLFSMIKGHDITLNQITKIPNISFTILGRDSSEKKIITKIAKDKKIQYKEVSTENEEEKTQIYKSNGIFVNNARNEPFGITTLEACTNSNYVIGLNNGGTTEIIRHGINGFIYPNDEIIYKKVILDIFTNNQIKLTIVNRLNWRKYCDDFLYLYHYLKNEPNE